MTRQPTNKDFWNVYLALHPEIPREQMDYDFQQVWLDALHWYKENFYTLSKEKQDLLAGLLTAPAEVDEAAKRMFLQKFPEFASSYENWKKMVNDTHARMTGAGLFGKD